MARNSLLQLFRQVHLYFGLFISPALLFFAITGGYQTLGLHESGGTSYKPPAWMATLAQIHKKQTSTMPTRKAPGSEGTRPGAPQSSQPRPDGSAVANPELSKASHLAGQRSDRDAVSAKPKADRTPAAAPEAPRPVVTLASKQKQHLPLKLFFLVVSVGLLVSTLTGIYMSYKYNRSPVLVTALLILGTAIPLVLLRF